MECNPGTALLAKLGSGSGSPRTQPPKRGSGVDRSTHQHGRSSASRRVDRVSSSDNFAREHAHDRLLILAMLAARRADRNPTWRACRLCLSGWRA